MASVLLVEGLNSNCYHSFRKSSGDIRLSSRPLSSLRLSRHCTIKTRRAHLMSDLSRQGCSRQLQSVSASLGDNGNGSGNGTLPRVAVLGIGLMGNKVAQRLAERGFEVVAWNRSSEKAQHLSEVGITVEELASSALLSTDVALLLLADADAIREALFGGASQAAIKGKTILQMGTIGPSESRDIAELVEAAGGIYIEAPVLGSQPEAAAGKLLVMVGARTSPETSLAWPVLTALGLSPQYIGDVGTAAAVKLSLNQLIASLTIGFSTSLGLLERNGVDVTKFMDILRESALYAPTFDKKLQRMLDRDYSKPNFPTKHLLKDIKLFGLEAAKAGLDTNLLTGLETVIESTVQRGLGNTDYSAVYDGVINPLPPVKELKDEPASAIKA